VPTNKPNLYRGNTVPLYQLSADDFEDFTSQALNVIGPRKGFEIVSGRQPARDEGFDCTGKNLSDGHTICIQCKRYTPPFILRLL
jgi:hypothetical protein